MSFGDFTMIPADDPQSTPDDDLDAAVQGALAISDVAAPVNDDPPLPFGRTWQFDWRTGQFVRAGGSPIPTSGFGALAEWCMMAVHAARFAHPVFSDDFGMEKPDGLLGEFAVGEALADWERHLIDALLVHERVSAIENVELRWDPVAGVLYIDNLDVVTDEDEFSLHGATVNAGGGGL